MATNYTTNLALAKPTTGELAGTWGDVVNQQITDMLEEAITGIATINGWVTNTQTLTLPQGSTGAARAAILDLQDAAGLTAAGTLNIPDGITKIYIVVNNTSYQVTVKTITGTGIAVPTGETMWVYSDGTNIVEATNTYLSSAAVGGTLTVDTINEYTAAAGVTIDSVLLKDDTVNATDIETGTISANDGTQSATIANATGVMTIASAVLTTADINGGTIDGTTIGATTPAAITGTTLTSTTSATLQHSSTTRLATTATGIDVTGTAVMDGLTAEGTVVLDGAYYNVRTLSVPVSSTRYLNVELSNSHGIVEIIVAGYSTAGSANCAMHWTDCGHGGGNAFHKTNLIFKSTNSNPVLGSLYKTSSGTYMPITNNNASFPTELYVLTRAVGNTGVDAVVTLETVEPTATQTINTFVIDEPNGRIGIGTDSPNGKLTLNSGASDTSLYIQTANTGGTGSDGFSIAVENATSDVYLNQRESANLRFLTSSTERLRITSTGEARFRSEGDYYFYGDNGNNDDFALYFGSDDTIGAETSSRAAIFFDATNNNAGNLEIFTKRDAGALTRAMRIDYLGDIYQYRDDGTTVGTKWDASVGYYGIGTSSPSSLLNVVAASNGVDDDIITLGFAFDAGTEAMGSIGTHNLDANNGGLKFSSRRADVLTEMLRIGSAETVFNEDGLDQDFRVETDTNDHAFYIDGGNNGVSFFTSINVPNVVNINGGLERGVTTSTFSGGGAATNNWFKIYERQYTSASSFGLNPYKFTVLSSGDTTGAGGYGELYVTTKQQGTAKYFNIYPIQSQSMQFAYKWDSVGGGDGNGQLEIWVKADGSYSYLDVDVHSYSHNPAANVFNGVPQFSDTGSATQPTGSTLIVFPLYSSTASGNVRYTQAGFASNQYVINNNGDNIDFRVEGDVQQNLIFADASKDCVYLGASSLSNDTGVLRVDGGSGVAARFESQIDQSTIIVQSLNTTTGAVGGPSIWGEFHDGTAVRTAGYIEFTKSNATVGNYESEIGLYTRQNGSGSFYRSFTTYSDGEIAYGASNTSYVPKHTIIHRDNGGGSGIFATRVSGKAQMGELYAYDTATNNYCHYSLKKNDESSSLQTTLIAGTGLTIVATNAGGTIQLSSTASTVKQIVTIYQVEE